jgi:hypothetical protein
MADDRGSRKRQWQHGDLHGERRRPTTGCERSGLSGVLYGRCDPDPVANAGADRYADAITGADCDRIVRRFADCLADFGTDCDADTGTDQYADGVTNRIADGVTNCIADGVTNRVADSDSVAEPDPGTRRNYERRL